MDSDHGSFHKLHDAAASPGIGGLRRGMATGEGSVAFSLEGRAGRSVLYEARLADADDTLAYWAGILQMEVATQSAGNSTGSGDISKSPRSSCFRM